MENAANRGIGYSRLAELAHNLLEMLESEERAVLANQIDKFEREAIMETGTIVTVLYISCIIALVAAAVLDWVTTRRPDDSPWE